MITLSTSAGDIHIELYADKAPISVKNFLAYVDSGHYDGTVFHRVIPDFMIQGGGFTAEMQQKKTGAPIKNEADNGLLDHGKRDFGYAVFGKVVKGTEVVDKIAEAKTGRSGGHSDVPLTPIT